MVGGLFGANVSLDNIIHWFVISSDMHLSSWAEFCIVICWHFFKYTKLQISGKFGGQINRNFSKLSYIR